jgi:hypothetical protein
MFRTLVMYHVLLNQFELSPLACGSPFDAYLLVRVFSVLEMYVVSPNKQPGLLFSMAYLSVLLIHIYVDTFWSIPRGMWYPDVFSHVILHGSF